MMATEFNLGIEKYMKNYLEIALLNYEASPYPEIPYIYGSVELLMDSTLIHIKEFSY